MENKRARNVLSQAEIFNLGKLISAHCKVVNGYAVYEEGWSDERILMESSILSVTLHNVIGLRTNIIGVLPKKMLPMVTEQLQLAVEELQTSLVGTQENIRVLKSNQIGIREDIKTLSDAQGGLANRLDNMVEAINALQRKIDKLETWAEARPVERFKRGE